MINFEEIAEKMEKVKQNYYKTNEKDTRQDGRIAAAKR